MSNENRIDIGRHRAALRVRCGLSQSALATKAGVGLSTVTSAEDGGMLREGSIRALASALGISAREYLEPESYGAVASRVPAGVAP